MPTSGDFYFKQPSEVVEAVALQEKLRGQVRLCSFPLKRIRHIAGADIAVNKGQGLLVGAVVVLAFPDLEPKEEKVVTVPLSFPYVPGLLSFREIPALLACLEKIKTPIDAMLCDGQGIAHPRRFGLASHLGLILGMPTIGCAKSRLVGDHQQVGVNKGDFVPLRFQGKPIGCVLRTRTGVKPLYVSPGHLIDTPSSRRVVLACLRRYRLPEPTRRAHILAGKAKRRLSPG
jgi:deoxyribonuclease V